MVQGSNFKEHRSSNHSSKELVNHIMGPIGLKCLMPIITRMMKREQEQIQEFIGLLAIRIDPSHCQSQYHNDLIKDLLLYL
jgi:hypothetical protein